MISDSTNTIISIHAPRVGSDLVEQYPELESKLFQSTLPVWGATKGKEEHTMGKLFQSTLPVWGATMLRFLACLSVSTFQSTLPVWGATFQKRTSFWAERFQSTLPVWGATRPEWVDKILSGVSIHAPRVGSDWTWATRWLSRMSFNPRSPWGERRITRQYILTINRFQSTLPVGGATT